MGCSRHMSTVDDFVHIESADIFPSLESLDTWQLTTGDPYTFTTNATTKEQLSATEVFTLKVKTYYTGMCFREGPHNNTNHNIYNIIVLNVDGKVVFKDQHNPVSYAVQKHKIVSRYAKSAFLSFLCNRTLGQ